MNDQPFSTELNEEQREAVYYNDGPLLVIAGAGSGKTRCTDIQDSLFVRTGRRAVAYSGADFYQ